MQHWMDSGHMRFTTPKHVFLTLGDHTNSSRLTPVLRLPSPQISAADRKSNLLSLGV